VWYDLSEFIIRDVDAIPDLLENCMSKDSSNQHIRWIYQVVLDEAEELAIREAKAKQTRKGPPKTIWGSFCSQMDNLMEEMAEALLKMGDNAATVDTTGVEPTELHFIRCIKPRPKPDKTGDKRPGLFVYTMTLQQITYMGVLESVELKQKNFPFRKKFQEFYAEYEILSPRYTKERYS